MNTKSLSISMPNIHLVVNNTSVKFESLKSIAISAPTSVKTVQQNKAFLPAVCISVILHLLIALVLFQKSPIHTPVSTSLPMMVSFVNENKVEAPIETPPTEIIPAPARPKAQLNQKVVATSSEKAAVLSKEQNAKLIETTDLNPEQNIAQLQAEPKEAAAINEATPILVPVKDKPLYIAPSYGADYLHNPAPKYPNMARRNGEQGRVLLKVLVTLNGDAGNVTLEKSSGSTYLDEAAINAVKSWKFTPARSNNEPVSGFVTVPISFSLES